MKGDVCLSHPSVAGGITHKKAVKKFQTTTCQKIISWKNFASKNNFPLCFNSEACQLNIMINITVFLEEMSKTAR